MSGFRDFNEDRVTLINFDAQPRTQKAKDYISDLIVRIEAHEAEHKPRKRSRRANDRVTLTSQVTAVGSYLALKVVRGDYSGTLVQRSHRELGKRHRYKRAFVTNSLKHVLDTMCELELIEQTIGYRREFMDVGHATTIEATDVLVDLIKFHDLSLRDFSRLAPPEVIILRSDRKFWEPRGRTVDYEDSAKTMEMRNEVCEINAWIAQADLAYVEAYPEGTDTGDRHLRRIFNGGSFDLGGRLYGGFWQGLSKDQRLLGLRINGEPIACLDYKSMATRLAYAKEGAEPPPGDMYDIEPYGPRYREGIKTVMNASYYNEDMKQKPKDTRRLLPNKSIKTILAAIKAKHPAIAHIIESQVGLHLMKTESDILIAVLQALKSIGVVALPIHDAILVPVSAVGQACDVMQSVPVGLIGAYLPVDVDCSSLCLDSMT